MLFNFFLGPLFHPIKHMDCPAEIGSIYPEWLSSLIELKEKFTKVECTLTYPPLISFQAPIRRSAKIL